jgi:Tol biopolymer transport system component
MKHTRTWMATLLLGTLLALPAVTPAQVKAEVALRAAMETETVKGDLKSAIEQYKKIAQGGDRALAAKALVRMAECYQKLGDAQAHQKIYQQLVREYADQKEAVAVARARLTGPDRAAPGGGVALRKVWSDENVEGMGVFGGISPDGRYLSGAGRYNTAVLVHDLVTGENRVLNAGDWGTLASAISKDGSQVAYDKCALTCELWASPLGSGSLSRAEAFQRLPVPTAWPSPIESGSLPPARRLFASDEAGLRPHDWSPDGTRIAVSVRRKDHTVQIGWVAVADGSLRVLKSVDWRGPTRMFFSPDGSDIAFDLPANDSTDDRDVFVLAADGSRETPAAVSQGNDVVIGWSPDGRYLLFASDRSGAMGLWAVPFADHKPQGVPIVVKGDIGNVLPRGVTRSGALYWSAAAWNQDIEIVPLDLTTGAQTGPPVKPIQRFTGTNTQPAWSPDGKWLAYRSARGSSLATGVAFGPLASSVIGIRSSDTGDVRELRPSLSYFRGLTWAPDGRSLVVFGTDLKGRDGVFRIDARMGDVTPIIMPISKADELGYGVFSWSPDGSRLYYQRRDGSVHERDLSAGTERAIVGGKAPTGGAPNPGSLERISLSPDGRLIASSTSEGTSAVVVIIPVDGGERRTLFRVSDPSRIGDWILWTPDGRAVLVENLTMIRGTGGQDDVTSELWLVPLDGTTPRKIDIDLNRAVRGGQGRMQLHPDGRRLTFVSGRYPIGEVWALENFLTTLSESR